MRTDQRVGRRPCPAFNRHGQAGYACPTASVLSRITISPDAPSTNHGGESIEGVSSRGPARPALPVRRGRTPRNRPGCPSPRWACATNPTRIVPPVPSTRSCSSFSACSSGCGGVAAIFEAGTRGDKRRRRGAGGNAPVVPRSRVPRRAPSESASEKNTVPGRGRRTPPSPRSGSDRPRDRGSAPRAWPCRCPGRPTSSPASRSSAAGSICGSSPCKLITTSAGQVGRDFGDAVGAGCVIGSRHDGAAAEPAHRVEDPLVVGGDDHLRGTPGALGALVDVLDQVLPGLPQERLPGQPRRREPGRDDDGDLHGPTSVPEWEIPVAIRSASGSTAQAGIHTECRPAADGQAPILTAACSGCRSGAVARGRS